MNDNKYFNKDNVLFALSVLFGILVGVFVTILCIRYHLTVFGININIFIAPVIAGFAETILSEYTRNKSSGAISAIVIFFITNGIGWLFPSQPLTFNIFTVGGFILMLQAAFPLLLNYLLIGLLLVFTYAMGSIGSIVGSRLYRKSNSSVITDVKEFEDLNVVVFNSMPDFPILEYHGLIFAEDVLEFEEKNRKEQIQYISSTLEDRSVIKLNDYSEAREYIIYNLKKEAIKVNANAVIDIEFEYTNYNQQMPPDILIAAYGTAVTIDDKYLNL